MRTAILSALLVLSFHAFAAGDPYPQYTVMFFDGPCPAGWKQSSLNGRTVVPIAEGSKPGQIVATQNAPHSHTARTSITLGSVEYVLSPTPANTSLTSDGKKEFVLVGAQDPAVPVISYNVCTKMDPPGDGLNELPSGVVTFQSESPNCAQGFANVPELTGYYLVGLPDLATPMQAFGGAPLSPGEVRTHTHPFDGKIGIPEQEIIGLHGCCAKGYGKAGAYQYGGSSDPSSASIGYMQVIACSPK